MPITNPYLRLMRLHQPVGNWLLLWPCWWGLALAHSMDWRLYALFALGAVCMRSAGCIVNDMIDRGFDAQVERTKGRPLASGELSMRQAFGLLFLLLCISLGVAMALGREVVLWSALALPLVALYPLMKRITWWPQLFLGLTFNWGALVGFIAVRGVLETQAVLLYVACVFWTLGYDTIYAHQDKEDDAKIGVKSTARRLGRWTKPFVLVCYALFGLLFWYVVRPQEWAWFCMLCAMLQLFWQVLAAKLDSPESCKRIFRSNATLGWLWAGCLWISYWK